MLLRYSSKLATVEDLSFFLIRRVGTVATVCCILIYRIWHAYPTHISLHLATPTIIIAMRTFFSFSFRNSILNYTQQYRKTIHYNTVVS